MRGLSEREINILQSTSYRNHFRLSIKDGEGNWVNYSDFEGKNWVERIEISDDIDSPSKSYTFTLKRNIYKNSLSTLMKDSPFNLDTEENFSPKILIGREFKIEIAITELNSEPASEYWRIFERGIITRTNFERNPMTISAICISKKLKKYIREERVYGTTEGELVENEMQQIINDHESNINVTLKVPQSPGWNIHQFKQRKEYVYDAIRELAHQIGWELKTRYSNDTNDIEIMFYEPDRDPESVQWIFGPQDYENVTRLEMDIAEIRNVVRVVYSDVEEVDTDGNVGKRMVIEKSDQASIDFFDEEIFMEVSEASNSNINTSIEATTMANNMLHDLKDAKAHQSINMSFFFPVQTLDYYRFKPNGVHYDREQENGVVGYRHTIDFENARFRTVLDTHGRPNMSETGNPVGLHKEWLKREALPGLAKTNPFFPPSQPQNVIARTSVRGITVSYSLNHEADLDGYNIYCSDEDGFSASIDNKVASGRSTQFNINSYYNTSDNEIKGMVAGDEYFVLVRAYDAQNNLSETSTQTSAAASQIEEADMEENSITTEKIANEAVTREKIEDNAVNHEKTDGYNHPTEGEKHEIEIDGELKEVEIINGLIVDITDTP